MKSTALLTIFFCVMPVYAQPPISKPTSCPTVTAIKAAGVQVVSRGFGGWSVMNVGNNYNTPFEWAFSIVFEDAKDKKEALENGNTRLSELIYFRGPFWGDGGGWVCQYLTPDETSIGTAISKLNK